MISAQKGAGDHGGQKTKETAFDRRLALRRDELKWLYCELYNDDPRLGDARLCGTEAAGAEGDPFKLERSIACDLTLHAWMLSQSGIPVIYSGDEIGQLNDYTYHDDPEKREDSRCIRRGAFQWDLAEYRHDPDTRQGKLFRGLRPGAACVLISLLPRCTKKTPAD